MLALREEPSIVDGAGRIWDGWRTFVWGESKSSKEIFKKKWRDVILKENEIPISREHEKTGASTLLLSSRSLPGPLPASTAII